MVSKRSTKTDSSQLALFGPRPGDEDRAARERVLDGTCSFLVQAPAGSGKTGLLIQRFLALLARVERPERIVAMTFTRKAATEMRERIVQSLRDAASGKRGEDDYEQRTLQLASAALAQDEKQAWRLRDHPARLRIQTIDALCAGLARQAPLASRFGAMPGVEEKAAWLHREAAASALRSVAADDDDWRRLLAHLDNDADAAIAQLAAMLAKREQWIPTIPANDPEALRQILDRTLGAEIRGELAILRGSFPPRLAQDLGLCARYAAANLPDNQARAAALADCAAAGGLPPATVDALPLWRELADWLLLKNDASFRKSVDKNMGFPAKGGRFGAEGIGRKAQMELLLETLTAVPELAASLALVRALPPPGYYQETWLLVASVARVLHHCAAQLLLAFSAAGKVDFPQTTLAALEALGAPDEPTDLLLLLDQRIEHLLIDEFQDTSMSQYRLIQRLTAGWEPGDGRTLFAVGDPMQSIYRFRQAEVRLFVEAQQKGRIADVVVECCSLQRNFRSRPGIVEWVNAIFPAILGRRSDPWRGAVRYEQVAATRPAEETPAVTLEMLGDGEAEASAVVERVREARNRGDARIAILVRARPQLTRILPALRAAGLRYAAVELDALSQRPAVLDLVSLTHALMQPADRMAWLALLRAPWSAIALPDLFALIAVADEAGISVADTLMDQRASAALSADGRARFGVVAPVLSAALAARGRASLTARVRGAWLALGGPACVEEALDLDAAEQYFALLSQHERAGEIVDWGAFMDALDEMRAAPVDEIGNRSRLTVMTLHRAKGLEFETVIMPGLGHQTQKEENVLLRWRERPDGVLLAPVQSRGGVDDPLYDYLSLLEKDEEDAELGRLLYVGCTRAREHLHLIAANDVRPDASGVLQWKSPQGNSALAKLWVAMQGLPLPNAAAAAAGSPPPPRLLRMPRSWTSRALPPAIAGAAQSRRLEAPALPPFDWAHETARCMGIVGHRVFRELGEQGIGAWPKERIIGLQPRLASELAHAGVAADEIAPASDQILEALRRALGDERGQWLFDPSHREQRSEFALSSLLDGELANVVLDRSFIDTEGTRWVVDFKFSSHEGKELEAFLDSERERYRVQLERYAAVLRQLETRPIRLGLYFPLLGGWREWAAPD
jgi:ATP-dependent exoDNAse (exonuclease V) beta subunit